MLELVKSILSAGLVSRRRSFESSHYFASRRMPYVISLIGDTLMPSRSMIQAPPRIRLLTHDYTVYLMMTLYNDSHSHLWMMPAIMLTPTMSMCMAYLEVKSYWSVRSQAFIILRKANNRIQNEFSVDMPLWRIAGIPRHRAIVIIIDFNFKFRNFEASCPEVSHAIFLTLW